MHGVLHVYRWFALPFFRRCLYPAGKSRVTGDEPGAAFVSEIGPRPLNEHDNAIAKADQEKDMHEQPGKPGEISRDVQLANRGNSGGAADGSKVSFVEIIKVLAGLVLEIALNIFCDGASFLQCNGCDPGQQVSMLVLQGCEISDDKYFWVAGER